MMNLLEVFHKVGFHIEEDLKQVNFSFSNNIPLSEKLEGKIYYYQPLKPTKTSFYLVNSIELTKTDIEEFHERIWNEDKADLYIFPRNEKIIINYVATRQRNKISIAEIQSNNSDEELLEKINKSYFDTGALWLKYQNKLKLIKRQTVDEELINTLKDLRKKLLLEYSFIIDKNEKDEIVQALIDRTLFIKFLEDKHIINSNFYSHFYKDTLGFEQLLQNKNEKSIINNLFDRINKLFNNHLFKKPEIPEERLTDSVLDLIFHTITRTNLETGQLVLPLAKYQFDIIPIEFISHIYQIFLDDKKSEKGIFYTPEGLVKLIINDVIKEQTGRLLDPSCGSGIFLVLGLRKMLLNANLDKGKDVHSLIQRRCEFLKENIFGIEIEAIAKRLTVFSLYLELLHDIKPSELNKLISENIKHIEEGNFQLFSESFEENIIEGNTLETTDDLKIFSKMNFDFIIGNPPWKEIKSEDIIESLFYTQNRNRIDNKQMSQAFMVKVEEWKHAYTKFGFVLNSSNFYGENLQRFTSYFYNTYDISNIYEISNLRVFLEAKEPASVIIFSNKESENNIIKLFIPEETDFTKKFRVVLLRKDDIINIKQNDLIDEHVTLRDYLVGDKKDFELVQKLADKKYSKLKSYLKKDINNGIQLIGHKKLEKEFDIPNWKLLNKKQQQYYKNIFLVQYTRKTKSIEYPVPFLKPKHLTSIKVVKTDLYLKEIFKENLYEKFERVRPKNKDNYNGKRILINRTGKLLRASYVDYKSYFDFDIYIAQILDDKFILPIAIILNSRLINFYINISKRKRVKGSYPKITIPILKELPIPKYWDEDIINQISSISKNILSEKYSFEEKEVEINDLVFDLYELDLIERNRINDFFLVKGDVTEKEIEDYCQTFFNALNVILKNDIGLKFEYSIEKNLPIKFAGVKISFVRSQSNTKNPTINKVTQFINNDLLNQIGEKNILSFKERFYGTNSIYIIKDINRKNWSKTKAFEEAQIEIENLTKR